MFNINNLVKLKKKNQVGGRVKKSKKKNLQKSINKFNELINFTNSELSLSLIIRNIHTILIQLNNMVKNYNIETIVIIGDSPAIFAKLYQMKVNEFLSKRDIDTSLLNFRDLLKNLKIKYLPLSRLGTFESKDNIENLNNKIDDIKDEFKGKILWIDYINSGFSFLNFYDSLPKDVLKRSYYYLYGTHNYTKSEFLDLRDKLIKKKKMNYFDVDYYSIFGIFLARTLGNSERHETRCVEFHDSINLNKLVLYDDKDVPTKKLKKYMKKSYCSDIAEVLYQFMLYEGLENIFLSN